VLAGPHREYRASDRFATIHQWALEREAERRSISVLISDEVAEFTHGLPRAPVVAVVSNRNDPGRKWCSDGGCDGCDRTYEGHVESANASIGCRIVDR
jgi:hypothetical protein